MCVRVDQTLSGAEIYEEFDGAFDITVGPLTALGISGLMMRRNATQEEIDAVLPLVNYKDA